MARTHFLFAISIISASYQVPIPANMAKLAPYTSFQIPSVQESVEGNQIAFSYPLPADLVGPGAQPISLSGTIIPGQPLVLMGENASATCAASADGANAVCQVEYKNLGVDESQLEQYLSRTIQDPVERQSRLAVAQFFGSEPVGVLTYRLSY